MRASVMAERGERRRQPAWRRPVSGSLYARFLSSPFSTTRADARAHDLHVARVEAAREQRERPRPHRDPLRREERRASVRGVDHHVLEGDHHRPRLHGDVVPGGDAEIAGDERRGLARGPRAHRARCAPGSPGRAAPPRRARTPRTARRPWPGPSPSGAATSGAVCAPPPPAELSLRAAVRQKRRASVSLPGRTRLRSYAACAVSVRARTSLREDAHGARLDRHPRWPPPSAIPLPGGNMNHRPSRLVRSSYERIRRSAPSLRRPLQPEAAADRARARSAAPGRSRPARRRLRRAGGAGDRGARSPRHAAPGARRPGPRVAAARGGARRLRRGGHGAALDRGAGAGRLAGARSPRWRDTFELLAGVR